MSVYTPKILMKLVNFRHLKSAVGHDYVNENEVYNLQLKIKFTFRKDLNRATIVADKRVTNVSKHVRVGPEFRLCLLTNWKARTRVHEDLKPMII